MARDPFEMKVDQDQWLEMKSKSGEWVRFKASLNGTDIRLTIDAPTFSYKFPDVEPVKDVEHPKPPAPEPEKEKKVKKKIREADTEMLGINTQDEQY